MFLSTQPWMRTNRSHASSSRLAHSCASPAHASNPPANQQSCSQTRRQRHLIDFTHLPREQNLRPGNLNRASMIRDSSPSCWYTRMHSITSIHIPIRERGQILGAQASISTTSIRHAKYAGQNPLWSSQKAAAHDRQLSNISRIHSPIPGSHAEMEHNPPPSSGEKANAAQLTG